MITHKISNFMLNMVGAHSSLNTSEHTRVFASPSWRRRKKEREREREGAWLRFARGGGRMIITSQLSLSLPQRN